MVLFCFILSFVVSHLVTLSMAMNDTRLFHPECPAFECGSLGLIRSPFTYESLPHCGFFTVKNCNEPPNVKRKIQLKKGGIWFDVVSISQANLINISDSQLQQRINSRDCSALSDLALPTSDWFSLSTFDNLTLFNCSENHIDALPLYISSFRCPDYYTMPNSIALPNCSTSILPVRPVDNHNPSIQFTAHFQLKLTISQSCNDCLNSGGICQTTLEGKSSCSVETEKTGDKAGNKQLLRKIVLGIGIPLVLLSLLFFGLWYCKKRLAAANFLAFQLHSKSDLDGGGHVYFELPIFSYSELEKATTKFDRDKELGRGGFGAVYLGKLYDGREVAVKRLYQQTNRLEEQFMNEVKILTRLRHKNLVTLYGCSSSKSPELLLVYEFIPNGTVADHLHGKRANPSLLTWPVRMGIAIETASALAYLHASDIIHRDVKTNNILLDNNFSVKVADFGISRLFPINVSHISTAPQGTFGYIDPQYFNSFQLTTKSDVYAFGVVLLELVSSMPAVDTTRHSDEIGLINLARNRIQKQEVDKLIDPQLWCQSDNEVRKMIHSVARLAFLCLQQDKEKRPTMEQALEALKRIERGEEEVDNEADDSVLLKKLETQ